MHWEDEQALEVLKTKTEEVSYPHRETGLSKDILNSILEDLSDSDSDESIEKS